MARAVGSVLVGLICFSLLEFALSHLAQSAWPDYAAAVPDRCYSLSMLLVRLIAGAAGVVTSGMVTAAIARDDRQPVLWLGVTMLTISIVWHIRIWPEYPVWYHLVWFACLIPAALLGGRLKRAVALF